MILNARGFGHTVRSLLCRISVQGQQFRQNSRLVGRKRGVHCSPLLARCWRDTHQRRTSQKSYIGRGVMVIISAPVHEVNLKSNSRLPRRINLLVPRRCRRGGQRYAELPSYPVLAAMFAPQISKRNIAEVILLGSRPGLASPGIISRAEGRFRDTRKRGYDAGR